MGSLNEEKGQALGASPHDDAVAPDSKSALGSHDQRSHEHIHEHLHHANAAADHSNHPHEVKYIDMTERSRPQSYEKKDGEFATTDKTSLGTDEEMGNVDRSHDAVDPTSSTGFLKKWYRRLRAPIHLFIWLVFTA
jgi:hypothetical protein